jgi:hypothetical protein
MPNTEEYAVEKRSINNIQVSITSYKIGDKYFCHISNIDPGATIARAEGASREEALNQALTKASKRVK